MQGVAHALLTKVNGATMHGNMLEEMQRRFAARNLKPSNAGQND